ncbi:hypothetical protein BC936DRAFT_147035 [Jimgerdemannia flammicorona]|uniref:Uncharacterized protein n=1 Tax=Jimgerdemannia flammicorona TaxID=994334 RepID=A0A433D6D3_9FUNG|nr:hypothetical protein BC936DRAFT_147035 [Jimgerdemannia flammicorona]
MIPPRDGIEQVPGSVIRVLAGEFSRLLGGECLVALVSLEVPLDVPEPAGVVNELEGVGGVTVHVAVAVWRAAVGKEDGHLVDGLGDQGEEIPKHVRVTKVRLGVSLLCVDEV